MTDLLNGNFEITYSYETGVIGSILLDEKCFPKIIDKLEADDFQISTFAEIYATMCEMYAKGRPIDFISVTEKMTEKGFNKDDLNKLTLDLWNRTPTAGHVEEYATGVQKASKVRKIITLVDAAMSEHTEPESMTEMLLTGLHDIERGTCKGKAKSMHDLWVEFVSWSQADVEEKQIKTGYPGIDNMLNGMSPGNLILIAARPAVGKSAFGAGIALKAAENGIVSVVFSAEMSSLEIFQRYISSRARVSLDTIVNKGFKKEDCSSGKVINAATALGEHPLYVYDDPGITILDIRRTLQAVKNVGFVVIDYVQLMKSTDKSENRNLEIAKISSGLKSIAKEFKIPVVALSQLSRKKGETDEPALTDLRDSGSLEQDADKVIMLWKLDAQPPAGEFPRVGAKIAKNRMGKIGVVVLRFNGENMTFFETTEEYVPKKRSGGKQFEIYDAREDPDFPFAD